MTETAQLSVYEDKRKSTGVAYLLWLFIGLFGAHRLYASAGKTGWYMMALHVGGWALLVGAFFWGSHSTTETYETAFGVSSFTNVEATARGGVVATIGWAMRAIAWLWWLLDIFLVPGMVRRCNSLLAIRLGLGGLR
jgi:TM2 domain-containing membrane protein YozV